MDPVGSWGLSIEEYDRGGFVVGLYTAADTYRHISIAKTAVVDTHYTSI